IAIINKSTNNKCQRGYGEKRTLLHCWWECKLVQPLQRTVWRYLRKLYIEWYHMTKMAFSILGLLCFQTNFEIFCSSSVKNVLGTLIGIALNL
uniref:Uncharacterized protein n=1 Tax=Sus scrofa TaxID=9823 RepID=A0A8D1T9H2_PIG